MTACVQTPTNTPAPPTAVPTETPIPTATPIPTPIPPTPTPSGCSFNGCPTGRVCVNESCLLPTPLPTPIPQVPTCTASVSCTGTTCVFTDRYYISGAQVAGANYRHIAHLDLQNNPGANTGWKNGAETLSHTYTAGSYVARIDMSLNDGSNYIECIVQPAPFSVNTTTTPAPTPTPAPSVAPTPTPAPGTLEGVGALRFFNRDCVTPYDGPYDIKVLTDTNNPDPQGGDRHNRLFYPGTHNTNYEDQNSLHPYRDPGYQLNADSTVAGCPAENMDTCCTGGSGTCDEAVGEQCGPGCGTDNRCCTVGEGTCSSYRGNFCIRSCTYNAPNDKSLNEPDSQDAFPRCFPAFDHPETITATNNQMGFLSQRDMQRSVSIAAPTGVKIKIFEVCRAGTNACDFGRVQNPSSYPTEKSYLAKDYGWTFNLSSRYVNYHASPFTTSSGNEGTWVTDVCVYNRFEIRGTVFLDTNRNSPGSKSDDATMNGVLITATDANGINYSTTSLQDGTYRIPNLRPGTYTVSAIKPLGYKEVVTNTPPSASYSITLTTDDLVDKDFFVRGYAISGNVFVDQNKNGIKDTGEVNYTASPIAVTTAIGSSTVQANTGGGSYSFVGILGGNYTISYANLPATHIATYPPATGTSPPSPSHTVRVGAPCTSSTARGYFCIPNNQDGDIINVNFGIEPVYPVRGTFYFDADSNGLYSAGDSVFTQSATATLTYVDASGVYRTSTTTTGSYAFSPNVPNGTYFLAAETPLGYRTVVVQFPSITINNAGIINADFFIQPFLSISGFVYLDDNRSNVRDGGEGVYTGELNTSASSGTMTKSSTSPSTGAYSIGGLVPGTYTVAYTNPPTTTHSLTYPQGSPPSHSVTVGPSCNTDTLHGSTCSNGNIQNLNFGVTQNSGAWWQCQGGNCRRDDGINNPVPPTIASSCQLFASAQGPSSTNPGIIFSGKYNYYFCAGSECRDRSSPTRWIVGRQDEAQFKPVNIDVIRTSYSYLTTTAKQKGITPTPLPSSCTTTPGCDPNTFPSGVYKTNSNENMYLSGLSVGPGKKYIFIIDGDLYIPSNTKVWTGGSVMFSTSGNIFVGSQVDKIEGFFSADRDFVIRGNGTAACATSTSSDDDKPLTIEGAVVVNAGLRGGALLNQRDLCAGNLYCPTYTIIHRPDLILNAPELVKVQSYVWQEVAPGPGQQVIRQESVFPTPTPEAYIEPTLEPTPEPFYPDPSLLYPDPFQSYPYPDPYIYPTPSGQEGGVGT